MMFKTSAIILTLSAALNLVLASSVTITSPEPNAVWEAGSTVHIKWKVNDKATGPIRLQYASGPSQALVINGVIADDVDASAGQYSWKIPSSLKAKKYVIEAGPNGKDLSFAGYITVRNHKKTTTKKHTTKHNTKKHTTKKHITKKHTTKKHTTKKHTTKKHTTKKTKPTVFHTVKGKEVCVGYPTRGEGYSTKKVSCHAAVQAVSKKHTTKKHTTKKHTTKK